LKRRQQAQKCWAAALKFNFGEHNILLNGKGDSNVVTTNDSATAADCTVDVALEDLEAMLNGSLNPMTAFMSGKIKVNGDMSVAMKLPQIMA
jgi:acyl-CoA dehydrogenase